MSLPYLCPPRAWANTGPTSTALNQLSISRRSTHAVGCVTLDRPGDCTICTLVTRLPLHHAGPRPAARPGAPRAPARGAAQPRPRHRPARPARPGRRPARPGRRPAPPGFVVESGCSHDHFCTLFGGKTAAEAGQGDGRAGAGLPPPLLGTAQPGRRRRPGAPPEPPRGPGRCERGMSRPPTVQESAHRHEEQPAHRRRRGDHRGRGHLHAAGPRLHRRQRDDGVTFWAVAGPLIALAGIALAAFGLRRALGPVAPRPRGHPAPVPAGADIAVTASAPIHSTQLVARIRSMSPAMPVIDEMLSRMKQAGQTTRALPLG